MLSQPNQRSPQGWWLYGRDLELARELQLQRIAGCESGEVQAFEIAQLTYLGNYSACHQWLDRTNSSQFRFGRQAKCRALLAQGRPEGWACLADYDAREKLRVIKDLLNRSGKGLVIDLVGGIGDQLQMVALVLALNSRGFFQGRLWLRPSGSNAPLINAWLQSTRVVERLVWPEHQIVGFCSSPFFRILLSGMNEVLEYQSFAKAADGQMAGASGFQILCCWRTKPDRLNPFTSFSRSLPLRTVFSALEQWQPVFEERGIRLLDLSDYTKDEQALLQERFPFVECVRRKVRSLADTYELIGQCKHIISVDTSLTHLAATSERQVHLLLPLFPDERWVELLAVPGVYRDWVVPHRQTCFHDWDVTLRSVAETLGLVVA